MVARPADEGERLSSLRAHAILDTPPDLELDRVVRAAALQLRMPIAKLNLVDAERQWTKSAFGAQQGLSVPRDDAFCAHTILAAGQLTIVADAAQDPRFARNPMVTAPGGIRFYAGVPITDAAGHVLGALAVLDRVPRAFDQAAQETLHFLGEVVSSLLPLYRLNARLHESEDHYHHAMEMNPQMPWTASPEGQVEEASARWGTVTGTSAQQALGRGWQNAVHPDDVPQALAKWAVCLPSGQDLDLEYRLRQADQAYRWFRVRAAARRDTAGRIKRWYGTVEDIHDRKLAELALRDSEMRLREALDAGRLGPWEFDIATGAIVASDLAANHLGLAAGADLTDYETLLTRVHPQDRDRHRLEVEQVLATRRDMDIEYRSVWPDGSLHWVRVTGRVVAEDGGPPRRAVGLSFDITERKRAEQMITHAANHDALTGLPNRRLLESRVADALAEGGAVALLCIDLDQFKIVNDSIGQVLGDALLRQVAERLQALARPGDTLARYGGDEFAWLIRHANARDDVGTRAQCLLQAMGRAFDVQGRPVVLSCTVGIAIGPADADAPEQLRRNADTALQRAKATARGFYRFFERAMDLRLQAHEAMKLDLRAALERDELSLVYQPLVDLRSGAVSGFEALMRWRSPKWGLVSPADFIPIAEETGLIVKFGAWALRQACGEAAGWPAPLGVSVNLSAAQLNVGDIRVELAAALERSGLPAGRLELEVTETMLLQDSAGSMLILQALRGMGVRLALDDFGTGYSSLAYLRRFTFDKIKIDKSLVSDLPDDSRGNAIVHAIIGLGRSLGMDITAEGVETAGQRDFLHAQGCTQAQGYLFSMPIAAADVPGFLADRRAADRRSAHAPAIARMGGGHYQTSIRGQLSDATPSE